MNIELNDSIEDSKFFSWKEALRLRQWDVHVFPSNGIIYNNIVEAAKKMDLIRELFDKPVFVTSWLRPVKYNILIGGAISSSHITGLAVDFLVDGMDSDNVRRVLYQRLKDFNIRMEAMKTKHVHIDLRCDVDMDLGKRYFMP